MATTLDLRRRIRSAQNISKTTRAMQMIAASKLRRAQEAAVSSRPYVTELMALARSLAPKNAKNDALTHTCKKERPAARHSMSLSAQTKDFVVVLSPI